MNTVDWMALLQSRGVRTFVLKDLFDLAGALRKAVERRNLNGVIADPSLATRLTNLGAVLQAGGAEGGLQAGSAAVVIEAAQPGPAGELRVCEDWTGKVLTCQSAAALFVVISLSRNYEVEESLDGWIVPWPPEMDPDRLLVVFL